MLLSADPGVPDAGTGRDGTGPPKLWLLMLLSAGPGAPDAVPDKQEN